MKIKIITELGPWVGGKPRALNETIEASEEDGNTLIEKGFGERVEGAGKVSGRGRKTTNSKKPRRSGSS